MPSDYRFDFSNLRKSPWVGELTRYLAEYEKRARKLFHGLDIKSKGRSARKKGLQNLEKLSAQANRTRQDLERKVTELVQKESKRLGDGVNELLDYVRRVAKAENPPKRPRSHKVRKSTRSTAKARRQTAAPKANLASAPSSTAPTPSQPSLGQP